MAKKLEKTHLIGEANANPQSEVSDVTHYTRDDVIGFFYSVLSGFCLAVSAVFVKLLEGE